MILFVSEYSFYPEHRTDQFRSILCHYSYLEVHISYLCSHIDTHPRIRPYAHSEHLSIIIVPYSCLPWRRQVITPDVLIQFSRYHHTGRGMYHGYYVSAADRNTWDRIVVLIALWSTWKHGLVWMCFSFRRDELYPQVDNREDVFCSTHVLLLYSCKTLSVHWVYGQ